MKDTANASMGTHDSSELSQEIVVEAARWVARLNDDNVSDADCVACARWRAARPEHALAYTRMSELWQRFEPLQQLPSGTVLRTLVHGASAKSTRKARRGVAIALALFAGVLGCLGSVAFSNSGYLMADYRTGTGEQRTVRLDDGSRMTLNTQSSVDVAFDGAQRRVQLLRGEIMVEVSKDASRPFVVETPQATARALGTQYVVRRYADATEVTVIESQVRVCTTNDVEGGESVCVDLGAGERVHVGHTGIGKRGKVDIVAANSWTTGTLLVDDQPIVDVVRELARYRVGKLYADETALAGVRVSGVFPLDDTERALQTLATTQPVRLRRFTQWYVAVEPR